MKKEPRKHWSYSSLNQYLRCPLQFYFQRILKLPQPTVGSGLILGSAIHNALAVYHRYLMENKEPVEQQVRQEFFETWLLRAEESEVEYKAKESQEDLMELGLSLLKLYMDQPPVDCLKMAMNGETRTHSDAMTYRLLRRLWTKPIAGFSSLE